MADDNEFRRMEPYDRTTPGNEPGENRKVDGLKEVMRITSGSGDDATKARQLKGVLARKELPGVVARAASITLGRLRH